MDLKRRNIITPGSSGFSRISSPRDFSMIDILLPAYNAGSFLAQTIESIRLQDQPGWRLLIRDGGSDDGTRNNRDYAKQFPQTIRGFYSETRNSPIKAFRVCWRKVQRCILCFVIR